MPPPKKLDLVPAELIERLKALCVERGFGQIHEVTDELNGWLAEDGLELTIGKTSVGAFSKMLKDQREAFSMAEMLLADMDLEAEGEIHRTLMNMIATSAMQMMIAVRGDDGHLDPKDLMNLGRMLKDLMGSAGIREKLLADERARIIKEANAKAAEQGAKAAREAGMSDETAEAIKASILGVDRDAA